MGADDTRARILAATDDLFGALGFDATTTREIAERSGVNKALIHYHFRSKDELLAVLLDSYYERLAAAMTASLNKRAGPEKLVESLADAYADFLAENRAFCSIVQREVANGRHVAEIVGRTLPIFQLGTQWLKTVVPQTAPELELTQLLTSVYGMVVTYFTYGKVLQQLNGTDPFCPEALEARKRHVRYVVSLLFREAQRKAKRSNGERRWRSSTRRTPRKKPAS